MRLIRLRNACGSTDKKSRFEVSFKSLDWVPNVENTRWFLVLRLEQPANNGLNRMLEVSNNVLSSFGQLPLYAVSQSQTRPSISENRSKSGSHSNRTVRNKHRTGRGRTDMVPQSARTDFSSHFHISVGWSIDKPSPEELKRATSADVSDLTNERIKFDTVKVKIGNAITAIPLFKGVEVGKGLIGGLTGL